MIQNAPSTIVTTEKSTLVPTRNTRTTNVAKSLFNDNRGKGAGAVAGSRFISTQQLIFGAKTRAGKKKVQQVRTGIVLSILLHIDSKTK